jgi:hypothetical protein
MYTSFATHIHVTRIAAMRIIFTRIGCNLLTCDAYMCRERHIHDPVLSSYSVYYHYLASPTPYCNKRHHTYSYVTCSKVNVARSSGTSSDVTISRYGSQDLKVIRNIPKRKDMHVNITPPKTYKCQKVSSWWWVGERKMCLLHRYVIRTSKLSLTRRQRQEVHDFVETCPEAITVAKNHAKGTWCL